MQRDTWTRRRVLRLVAPSIVGGLAGCAGDLDKSNKTTTDTTRASTTTSTTEPTTTEESSKEAPGYKEYHWHGCLFFEIDGDLVDFTQPKYNLDNLEKERPETVYFHFHKSAHGPNEWSNEKKVVTFARALNLLPGIGYSQASSNHVVTYEGTTYRESDNGVDISIYEGAQEINPEEYEVQHNDNFWVQIDTKSGSNAGSSDDDTRTGKLIFDVNNRRLNFETAAYEQAGTEQFEFHNDDKPYTWYTTGKPVTLAETINTLPPIEYTQDTSGSHTITYDAGDKYNGTYRASANGTEILIRQRTTDVDPKQYELRDGDIIWVYLHTDQAPDNEH